MQVTRAIIDEAAAQGLLKANDTEGLWKFLVERQQEAPTFKAGHVLYYLGAMIAIGAMTLFMTLGWQRFGGFGLLLISAAYGAAALALTEYLLRSRKLVTPAGIMAALAVVMVPLGIYALQHLLGFWTTAGGSETAYRDYHTHIDWRWVVMELATLLAGALALWRYRLPFIVLPVAVTLWYMSMDLAPLLLGVGSASVFSYERKLISVVFGIGMTLLAFYVDLRSRHGRDFAFWLYVFGVLTFWGGLTMMESDSELSKALYCVINLAMIAAGAALSRRVFAVFGGLGVALYLGHLSHTIFRDSMLFPVALTAIGLAVIAGGIYWQRHEAVIGRRLRSCMPLPVRSLLEQRAA